MAVSLIFVILRQDSGEDRSQTWLALDAQFSAMACEYVFDDGQSEAGAAESGAAEFRADAIESLGEARRVMWCDALSEILDSDGPCGLAFEGIFSDADFDIFILVIFIGAMLDGVIDEIADGLDELFGIALALSGGGIFCDVDMEVGLLSGRAINFNRLADDGDEVYVFTRRAMFLLLDSAK